MDSESLFEAVCTRFDGAAGVSRGKMFGAPGLRIHGKFFVCLVKGQLVAKLPAGRVEALLHGGEGRPFDPGMGRPMKEWVEVDLQEGQRWGDLAEEALRFVLSGMELGQGG